MEVHVAMVAVVLILPAGLGRVGGKRGLVVMPFLGEEKEFLVCRENPRNKNYCSREPAPVYACPAFALPDHGRDRPV